MKTPNEIKDEVAKSHGWDSWDDIWTFGFKPAKIKDLENEAMEAYARTLKYSTNMEKVNIQENTK